MSASDFPALSVLPAYPLTEKREAAGLTTKSEYGYVHGRRRFTMSRMTFGLSYPLLPEADKALLASHADSADISETFNWEHPWTRVWYLCRYAEMPVVELIHGGGGWWRASISLAAARLSAIEDAWGVSGDLWGDPAAPPIDVWGVI